jgi:hypothetical protein
MGATLVSVAWFLWLLSRLRLPFQSSFTLVLRSVNHLGDQHAGRQSLGICVAAVPALAGPALAVFEGVR